MTVFVIVGNMHNYSVVCISLSCLNVLGRLEMCSFAGKIHEKISIIYKKVYCIEMFRLLTVIIITFVNKI